MAVDNGDTELLLIRTYICLSRHLLLLLLLLLFLLFFITIIIFIAVAIIIFFLRQGIMQPRLALN